MSDVYECLLYICMICPKVLRNQYDVHGFSESVTALVSTSHRKSISMRLHFASKSISMRFRFYTKIDFDSLGSISTAIDFKQDRL